MGRSDQYPIATVGMTSWVGPGIQVLHSVVALMQASERDIDARAVLQLTIN